MQKLIYLIQSNDKTQLYLFNWHIFGPFSQQVQYDMEELVSMNIIDIKYDDEIPIYRSQLTKKNLSSYWFDRIKKFHNSITRKSTFSNLYQILHTIKDNPIKMEILASLDYLYRHELSDKTVNSSNLISETTEYYDIKSNLQILSDNRFDDVLISEGISLLQNYIQ